MELFVFAHRCLDKPNSLPQERSGMRSLLVTRKAFTEFSKSAVAQEPYLLWNHLKAKKQSVGQSVWRALCQKMLCSRCGTLRRIAHHLSCSSTWPAFFQVWMVCPSQRTGQCIMSRRPMEEGLLAHNWSGHFWRSSAARPTFGETCTQDANSGFSCHKKTASESKF